MFCPRCGSRMQQSAYWDQGASSTSSVRVERRDRWERSACGAAWYIQQMSGASSHPNTSTSANYADRR